jgi:hypothetical protein
MKILNRKEFLTLDKEVLYTLYEPCIFTGLFIKNNTLKNDNGENIDFFISEIIAPIDCENSGEYTDKCIEAGENHIDLQLDFKSLSRDGMFDEEELYAVYSKKDIKKLIERLNELL